jgi:hypothetical protein
MSKPWKQFQLVMHLQAMKLIVCLSAIQIVSVMVSHLKRLIQWVRHNMNAVFTIEKYQKLNLSIGHFKVPRRSSRAINQLLVNELVTDPTHPPGVWMR